jgi:hypothetical protein
MDTRKNNAYTMRGTSVAQDLEAEMGWIGRFQIISSAVS